MRITHVFVALLASAVFSAQAANTITVNGKRIKNSLIEHVLKSVDKRGGKIDDNVRAVVIDKFINSELVIQQAKKEGMDKKRDFEIKSELLSRDLLAQTYLEEYSKKNPVSESELKSEYKNFKKAIGDKEYKARHVLVKTEDEAKDIIAKLTKGADFAALAKEKSLDSSKSKGGDLGWFSLPNMVRPFAEAVSRLQVGLYTTIPVRSQFGWHVIKLEETRPSTPPTYDQVKEELKNSLKDQKLQKMISDLRAKAKVVGDK